MTPEQLKKKKLWFVLIILYFVAGYFACGHFNMNRIKYFDVGLSFEKDIPFLPIFIIGYTSVYFALAILYAVIDDFNVLKKGMIFFFFVSTVHFIIFILVPVKMTRPDLSDATGFMTILTNYYYLIDNPTNCFPSLHVSYPFAATLLLWNYKRNWGYFMAAATIFIAASVLFVKQHYFIDVVGAIVTTSAIYIILGMILRKNCVCSLSKE